ncbi:MAG: LLM class flavin-dependent oxidoreductase [Actinobacteria bacterium]|nr:LLM class flavin-dependent oxidoreductase [Actinomycetota bacterium]
MKLSLFVNDAKRVDRSVDQIVDAEARGLHGAWVPQIMGFDAMTVLALAAARTERIFLGTSVVPTWPRHPAVMAQQALTVSQVSDGRFRLGFGTSHVPVIEGMYGLNFEKPIRHIAEYTQIVKGLVSEGSVSFQGEQYRVTMGSDIPDDRMPVMISVLSEQMCRAAGAHADGAITWLAPPSYIASTVVPLVRAGAEAAGREPPPVICQVPATASGDSDGVYKTVPRLFGIYPMLPFYNTMMQKAGLPGAAEALGAGWSPELIDAIVPTGGEAGLRKRAEEYFDAGADEVVYAPFPVGGDWEESVGETLDAMSAIVRA